MRVDEFDIEHYQRDMYIVSTKVVLNDAEMARIRRKAENGVRTPEIGSVFDKLIVDRLDHLMPI